MTADVPGLIDEQITTNGANQINGAKLNAVLKDVTQAGTAIINVNNINTKAEAYEDAATARDAVPESMRKAGAKITYLLAAGWMEDQFNGADISEWDTASNWKTTGPVNVSQNSETGKTTIVVGNETHEVATEPVKVEDDSLYIGEEEKAATPNKWNENPQYIEVTTDSNGNILENRNLDGSKDIHTKTRFKRGIDIQNSSINENEDRENRLEVETDADGRILSYTKKDGTKVYEKLEAHSLTLSNKAAENLSTFLRTNGYLGTCDWSNSPFVEIPTPTICAVINIALNGQVEGKGQDVKTTMEFFDKNGNYFKKPIVINAQGQSSMSYPFKNQSIDIDDGSSIKFGHWIACDSFHLKKYYIDSFRGQCVVGYKLTEQVYLTRSSDNTRPWSYLLANDSLTNGLGDFKKDYDTGALAHPDGFPVRVFFNGKDAGIYALNLKKDRANYYCKKDNQKNLILDGEIGVDFFTANGTMIVDEHDLWTDFEVRNPKISKDINGNKYDGDNPTEPSDDYTEAKNYIKRLTTAINLVDAESTTDAKKTVFESFFNVPFLIDYFLISQVLYHWDGFWKNWIWLSNDGVLWTPTLYDLDSILGLASDNGQFICDYDNSVIGISQSLPTGVLYELYKTELDERYKELRDKGVFSVSNIVSLLKSWIEQIGYDNLKDDIEKVVVSPYYDANDKIVVDGENNPILVPVTPSYRDGTLHYALLPQHGGFYNSLTRVNNWLTQRFIDLDDNFNYE